MPELDGFGVLSALVARFADRGDAGSHLRDRARRVRAARLRGARDRLSPQAVQRRAVPGGARPRAAARPRRARGRGHVADAGAARRLGSETAGPAPAVGAATRRVLDRIVVRGSDRVRLLPVEQISWIEADGMYVKLHTRDGAAHLHRASSDRSTARSTRAASSASTAPPSSTSTSSPSCGRTPTATTSPCCGIGRRSGSDGASAFGCRRGSASRSECETGGRLCIL